MSVDHPRKIPFGEHLFTLAMVRAMGMMARDGVVMNPGKGSSRPYNKLAKLGFCERDKNNSWRLTKAGMKKWKEPVSFEQAAQWIAQG